MAAVIERERRFLLVEETSQGGLVINQPAGHLEKGETLIEAVKREVLEETAWHFTPKGVIGLYLYRLPNDDVTYLRICFHGSCHNYQPQQTLDEGIVRALWLSRDELRDMGARLRSPMVKQCIEDYVRGHGFPLEYLRHDLPTAV